MISFLTVLCSSSTSADIDPDTLLNIGENGKIGLWETGGSAIAQEDAILLLPPIQYRKGCIWTDAEIPSIDVWQMTVNFKIEQATGGSFGVWFVKEYAQEGTFCGGPNVFRGLMVSGYFIKTESGNKQISLSVIQASQKPFQNNEKIQTDSTLDIGEEDIISLTFRFDHGILRILHGNKEIIEKEIIVDLSENYIGITAQNDHLPMKLSIQTLQFDLTVQEAKDSKRKRSMGNKKPQSQFIPSEIYRLRNPAFNKTIQEILLQEESGGKFTKDVSTQELFQMIDEINKANFDVASYSELNSYIRTNILNYSQKWQRRTLKLVDRVRNTRNVAGAALNYTTKMMEEFREQMQTTVTKTNDKMIDMYVIFNEIGARGIDVNDDMHQMAEEINNRSIVTWISYASIAEVVAIIVILIASNTCFKDRIYGRSLNM